MTRVVVTGLGVVAPGATEVERFFNGLSNGHTHFGEVEAALGARLVVGAVDPQARFDDLPLPSLTGLDRSGLFAVAAAGQALREAGFPAKADNPARYAAIIGNAGGGLTSIEAQYQRLYVQQQRPQPFSVVRAMTSSTASWVSIAFGLQGPCFVMSSACASGTLAIGTAYQLIKAGVIDMAVAGGAEAPLSQGVMSAWSAMRVLGKTACRPFSKNRDGLLLSEGAGVIVLESEEHAKARGARTDIEIAGFSTNADAGDIVSPSPDGMARAMHDCLADARLSPSDIAYVNAHGTGTRANDSAETQAMKAVFGDSGAPPVSSIKGATGHSLGAAGGLEAVATIMAVRKSVAPPTVNHQEFDPECDMDVIANVARPMQIGAALSNSFACGGLTAALAFRRAA